MQALPDAFIKEMQQLLGKEGLAQYQLALQQPAPTSIRYNPFKQHEPAKALEAVTWSDHAYYLPERPSFTLDPLFHAGVYYVQEASSMFVGQAVEQLFPEQQPLRVLDLCAAPGGKSTHLLSVLPPGSLLVANEVIRSRYQVLSQNLSKWGLANIIATNHDSSDFSKLEGFFDLILVDAPCSGEGLFRKDKRAIQEWSPEAVSLCAGRQKRILGNIVPALAPGGILLYSTCTYNRQENDENAEWLNNTFQLLPEPIETQPDWKVEQRSQAYQFYPHRNKGEGFYLAALKKQEGTAFKPEKKYTPLPITPKKQKMTLAEWVSNSEALSIMQTHEKASLRAIPKYLKADTEIILHHLRRSQAGLELGQFKGKNFVPAHSLSLSTLVNESLPAVNLPKTEALRFLKKEQFDADDIPQGWMRVQHQGHTLGWAKGLRNRVNNYFPKGWRIRMEV